MKNLTVILLILLSISACGQKFKKPQSFSTKKTTKTEIANVNKFIQNKPNKRIRKFNIKKYACNNIIEFVKPKPLN